MADLLKKVTFGQTGLMVSKLCYGTLALGQYHSKLALSKGKNLLVQAYRNGINFWDTAELYETYSYIYEAMRELDYPDDLVISSRSYSRDYDGMKEAIAKTLDALYLEKIHIFGLHDMGDKEEFNNAMGAIEALKEAKKSGVIGHIVVTTHSVEGLEIAATQPWVDVVFPLYNKRSAGIIGGTVEDMRRVIRQANENGKGVYVMKVLAGGHLVADAEDSIRFALRNPDIHSIAIGMDNSDELLMNLSIFMEQTEKVNIYKSKLISYHREIQVDPWCEGCGECVKICPNQAISLEFSQAKIDRDRCILCGYCASACKYFCLKVVKTL